MAFSEYMNFIQVGLGDPLIFDFFVKQQHYYTVNSTAVVKRVVGRGEAILAVASICSAA